MKTLRGLLRLLALGCSGGILVLGLLLFFAWLLFPRDFVRDLPADALNRLLPQWQWQVGSVHYHWPLTLQLEQVAALQAEGTDRTEVLRIESCSLEPDLRFFMRSRQWRGTFAARLANGSLHGTGTVQTDNDRQEITLAASLDAVNLAALAGIAPLLGRQVQGRLSGTIDARLVLRQAVPAALQARLQVVDGTVPLRQPVLGHDQLPFTSLRVQLAQEGHSLIVKNGVLNSPLCTGEFAGLIALVRPLAASAVSVRGTVQARPELFQQVRDQQELQALRLQAAQGPLAVMLSGTLHDPALAFERNTLSPHPANIPLQEQGFVP